MKTAKGGACYTSLANGHDGHHDESDVDETGGNDEKSIEDPTPSTAV